jgi:hypothetical protein
MHIARTPEERERARRDRELGREVLLNGIANAKQALKRTTYEPHRQLLRDGIAWLEKNLAGLDSGLPKTYWGHPK